LRRYRHLRDVFFVSFAFVLVFPFELAMLAAKKETNVKIFLS
jgi:hypothetical protein